MPDTFDPDAYLSNSGTTDQSSSNSPYTGPNLGPLGSSDNTNAPKSFDPDAYLGQEPADHGLSARQKLSPLGKALSPITSYPATYNQMRNETEQQMAEGVHQAVNPSGVGDVLKGVGKTALGAAGFVYSPISAAYRSVIGQPIEDVTGIPREYTEFAAQLATPYIGLTGPKLAPKPVAPAKPALPVNQFGITESAGQTSGDLPTIQAEQGALRGQAGVPAQRHAEEFFKTQQPEQLEQAASNVSKSLDVPGVGTTPSGQVFQGQELAGNPTDAANLVQRGLQKEAARQRANVKAQYDYAKSLPGSIDADTFTDMPVTIRQELSQNRTDPVYVDENTPNAARMLRYLNDRIGELKIRNDAALSSPAPGAISGVTLEGVEQWRKALSKIRADALKAYGTNASDARASQAVLKAFDDKVGEAVNSGAFTGDPNAVQAFNDARKAHTARMKLWGNDAIGKRLQSIIGDPRFEKDPATLNDVARWMYGESGSSNSLNVGTVNRIRKILGDQSPEWSAIKQGLFRQLIDQAGEARGYGQTASRLRQFLNGKGSDLANAVYSPAERDMFNAYADMYDRLKVPQAGANWPNTAAGIIPHVKSVGAKITGVVGAAIGHMIHPFAGDVAGYIVGEKVGKALTKAEEARNYKQVANMLPIISQRYKLWQQAVNNQQRLHTVQTQARLTAAATNLTDALSKLGNRHPGFAQLLTQGPSGPGTANANEQQRARGGQVSARTVAERALPVNHQLGMRVPKGGSSCAKCLYFKPPTQCGNRGFVAWNHGDSQLPAPPNEYCCDLYAHTFKRARGGKVEDGVDSDLDADELADEMIEQAKHFADGGVPTADDTIDTVNPTPPVDQNSGPATTMQDYLSNPERGYKAPDNTPASELATQAQTNLQSQSSRLPDPVADQEITKALLPDVGPPAIPDTEFSKGTKIGNKLFGTGGEERYQLWPERMIRSGFTLPHDVMTGEEPTTPTVDPNTGETAAYPENLIGRVQDLAGMGGTGGLAGAGEEAGAAGELNSQILGSSPVLRPAVKYQGRIYKAPVGGQHLDAIPASVYPEFQRQALSGEDISNFNFGFMNHKGQFLNREQAMDYAVKEGLIDPRNASQGALTTTTLDVPLSDTFTPQELDAARTKLANIGESNPSTQRLREAASTWKQSGSLFKSDSSEVGAPLSALEHLPHYTDNDGYTVFTVPKKFGQDLIEPEERGTFRESYGSLRQGTHYIMSPNGEIRKGGYWMDFPEESWNLSDKQYRNLPINDRAALEAKQQATAYKPLRIQFTERNQVVSPKTLLSDTSEPGAAIAGLARSAEPFYSEAERTIQNAPQSKMHGVQWANWLKNQPGVKPDELQYTGVDNWLRSQEGPVTKQQVQNFLDQNKIKLNDVVKQDPNTFQKRLEELENSEAGRAGRPGPELDEYNRLIQKRSKISPTKYSNWQLPGGENYREHLLTLPEPSKRIDVRPSQEGPLEAYYTATGQTVRRQRGDDNAMREWAELENNKGQPQNPNTYRSSHWDEPNVLAHMRTNERDVGGVPSLHLEELQSDWHQQGRKQGYIGEPNPDAKNWEAEPTKFGEWDVKTKSGIRIDTVKAANAKEAIDKVARSYTPSTSTRVPDAPFKTSWPELAMKRAIRMAVEEGKDRVSWTPGEAQAARYNLRKQIEELRAYEQPDGTYNLLGMPASGHSYHEFGRGIPKEKLPDYIGKDVAEKLLNQPKIQQAGGGFHELKGAQLEIGGEGMKGFYDQMLPKMVEKLGKQYGVKVKEGTVESSREEQFKGPEKSLRDLIHFGDSHNLNVSYSRQLDAVISDMQHGKTYQEAMDAQASRGLAEMFGGELVRAPKQEPVHYFDIPEKMKQDVLTKGFPLFSDTSYSAALNANKKNEKNVERPEKKEPTARAHGGRVVASLINTDPTEAQKHAGNYKKDHIHILGLPITIENAKGHLRSGIGKNGKRWTSKLPAHYGYVTGHQLGHDGDHVDVYVGPHVKSKKVFVINQIDADTKKFDEHKAMLGFATMNQALDTYQKGFSDGKGKDRIGSIVESNIDDFRNWLENGNTHKPYRDNFTYGKVKYKGVTVDQQSA